MQNLCTVPIYLCSMKSISFKNFRNSGDITTRIELKAISILTGCNSAGKSSAAKALLLLSSYINKVKDNEYNLIDTPLDLSKTVKLGTFDNVLNIHSRKKGIDTFTLGYSINSFFHNGEIGYDFTFGRKEGDYLGNGWLKSMTISVDKFPLVTFSIIDGNYKIHIDDVKGFRTYCRNYMIGQMAAASRNAKNAILAAEEYRETSFDFATYKDADQTISMAQRILSLDLSELKEEEEQLVSNGLLKRIHYPKDLNLTDLQISQRYADCLCKHILNIYKINHRIINFEEKNGRKLKEADIKDLLGTEQDLKDDLEHFYSRVPDYTEKANRTIKTKTESFHKKRQELESYINSNANNWFDYVRKFEDEFIKRIENEYNTDEWLHRDYAPKNIIDTTAAFVALRPFITALLEKGLNADSPGKISYIDDSTVEVRRLYPADDSSRFGKCWKAFNDIRTRHDNPLSPRMSTIAPGRFLQKWLKEFGICKSIEVSNVEGAIKIRLISEECPEGRPLADYGYGVTQLISLLLNIEIALNKAYFYYTDIVGAPHYVSPDMVLSRSRIIVEEPEVHLHPRLQSKLADMFRDATKYGARFIIETHSEYLVRRSQALVAEMGLDEEGLKTNNPFKVYYFPEKGVPYDMEYLPSGRFAKKFGEGFFDESAKWHMEILKNEKSRK